MIDAGAVGAQEMERLKLASPETFFLSRDSVGFHEATRNAVLAIRAT